ncbi:MAG: SpaA isopeptide-forming pilin-related protein [Clostridia bacterium]|nr:SpaA isopeptide-forming pilin-related protein [Clostridia bacterium]
MIKNKWTVKIILLVTVILAGLILCINSINGIPDAETNYKEIYSAMLNANQEDNLNWGNETGFEVDPDNLQSNGFEVPKVEGRAIYCTERGVTLAMNSNMYRGTNTAYSYYNWGPKIVSNIFDPANGNLWSRKLTDTEIRAINNVKDFGLLATIRTRGYYKCSNNHTTISADKAYVITADPCNQWTPRKQIVMWMLQITGGINVDNAETIIAKLKLDGSKAEFVRSDIEAIKQLYNEAKAYRRFKNGVNKALSNGGSYATNLTDVDNITSEYYTSNSNEYIKVGPYTMKYVNGKYKDEKIIFGGIGGKVDNETLGLYIQNGNQKIKVEKIITNDNERNTKNFKPCEESDPVSGLYVEHTTDFMRPSSEKEFYILIPKTELEADAKLYAHFTWMEAKGEKCVKNGISYQISEDSLKKINGKTKLKPDANNKIEFEATFTQQLTEFNGERKLKEFTLDLGTVQPPSKEGSYSINMRKIDENGKGLEGAEFLINGLLTYVSDKDGYILRGHQVINASGTETWTVEEKSAPVGYIVQPLKIVFNVYKVYNSTTNTYEVDRIEIVSANSNAEVTFNKEDQTITVQIKNIKANPENPDDLLDTYEIKAKKVNEQGNGLAGAKFNITWPTGKTSEATSNENGDLVISGQTPILGLNSEGEDHFKIEEIEAPAGYKMINGAIEFDVKKEKLITIDGTDKYGITGIINVNAPEGVTIELNGRGEISIVIPNQKDIKLISIGGNVWEDAKTGKASLGDGINSTTNNVDKNLENIKVSLYTEDMKLAELMPADSVTNIYNRINPTLTDANGNYKFEGVDESKKYYVVFEYDGQVYMPTEYLAKGISGDTIQNYNSVEEMLGELTNIGTGRDNGNSGSTGGKNTGTGTNTGSGKNTQTNTEWFEKWKANSKASEFETNTGKNTIEGRQTFNNRFAEIGASPKNYISKNTLGISTYLVEEEGIYYNKSYTRLELMGYTLKKTSKGVAYVQDKIQLVDGYKYNKYGTLDYDDNGAITSEWSEGLISQKIKEFIVANRHYPNEAEKVRIYRSIVGDMNDNEAWNKLQFIEDCKMSALTKSPFNSGIEYYPTNKNATFGTDLLTNYVNLGLWRRQEFNAQLTKDVVEVTTTSNGNSLTTPFNSKEKALYNIKDYMNDYTNAIKDNNGKINLAKQYADSQQGIYINRLNAQYYYNKYYDRPIKQSEYIGQRNLEVEIKYRITVYNLSQSLETQITEVVDYYDDSLQLTSAVVNTNGKNISKDKSSAVSESIYGQVTEKSFPGFNKVYIRLQNKQLATGEGITIDLTYKVKRMALQGFGGYINIGEKTNIAEINGYKTYYSANTSTPNRHGAIIGNNTTVAGLVDVNSTPGNLETIEEITNGVINFEDDSDKTTATLTITDDPTPPDHNTPIDSTNIISGCVWEDAKTEKASLGNGIRDSGEKGIAGVKVALCKKYERNDSTQQAAGDEKLGWIKEYNDKRYNKEYIYKSVADEYTTGKDGKYSFEVKESGDYYVLFGYGLDDATVLTNDEDNETNKILGKTGSNTKSYNGQDYKSTIFQAGFENGYDIENVDYDKSLNEAHVSKAIDDWARVEEVNKYSKIQTNHIAEVLASPTKVPTYLGEQYGSDLMGRLVDELTTNTWKIAKTQKIKIEGRKNGEKIENVDLGLVERPITQLQITNNVENVKVTLSDGSIVFDATQTAEATKGNETKNVIWKSNRSTTKGITGGFIQLYLDEELMYGATIQITYKMQINELNDYVEYEGLEYYAKGRTNSGIKVESKAKKLVCYIPNKMQFNKTQSGDWNAITDINEIIPAEEKDGENINNNLVNYRLKDTISSQSNTISKIEADNINNAYLNNNMLTISQLITKESAQGGYECKVEIVELENAVGRRMETSIVGNFNPANDPVENDEAKAEDVAVMPPFGIGQVFYYILTIVIAGMLVVGIIFIKKKVLVK